MTLGDARDGGLGAATGRGTRAVTHSRVQERGLDHAHMRAGVPRQARDGDAAGPPESAAEVVDLEKHGERG